MSDAMHCLLLLAAVAVPGAAPPSAEFAAFTAPVGIVGEPAPEFRAFVEPCPCPDCTCDPCECNQGVESAPAARDLAPRPHYLPSEYTLWSAVWCKPCQKVKPFAVAAGVGLVDVDEQPGATEAAGVHSLPTLTWPKGGMETDPAKIEAILRGLKTAPAGAEPTPGPAGVSIPRLTPGEEVVVSTAAPSPAGPVVLRAGRAQAPSAVASGPGGPQWSYPGNVYDHMEGPNHRLNVRHLSPQQAVDAHSRDHNQYGTVPTRVRGNVASPAPRANPVRSGCPGGNCPTTVPQRRQQGPVQAFFGRLF